MKFLEKEQWDILMKWGIHVICLGDPFQLPPIGEDNHVLDHPHIFLDEIMRQAQDSEIIRLSMDVREGKSFKYGGDKRCRIINKDKVSSALLLGADEIIVGKNNTRHEMNTHLRRIKWEDKYSIEPIRTISLNDVLIGYEMSTDFDFLA